MSCLCSELTNGSKLRRMSDQWSSTVLHWLLFPWRGNSSQCSGPSHVTYLVVNFHVWHLLWMYLVWKMFNSPAGGLPLHFCHGLYFHPDELWNVGFWHLWYVVNWLAWFWVCRTAAVLSAATRKQPLWYLSTTCRKLKDPTFGVGIALRCAVLFS